MLTVDELYEKTSEAYSFNRYNSWKACIQKLLKEGYNDFEVQAILLSTWTRWAADQSSQPYGKASAATLIKYIDEHESVLELTEQTFPDYNMDFGYLNLYVQY